MKNALDKAVLIGLMALLTFAALAHGVVEPWSALVFQFLVGGLLVLWAAKAVASQRLTLRIPGTAWPVVGLVALAAAQSIAWTDKSGNVQSLSFDVEATRGTLMMLVCMLAVMLLVANFIITSERMLGLMGFLIAFGCAMAIFGLVQHYAWNGHVYWIRQTRSSAFGPFFNRDHFAGYMEFFIALPAGLIVTRYVEGEKRLLYGAASMLMGVAAVFTLSRGGMIAIVSELIFLAVMSQALHRRSHHLNRQVVSFSSVGLILAAIVAGVVWIGAEPVLNRIATGDPKSMDLSKAQSFYSVRGEIWEDTLGIIKANPIFGAGLGSFETAYPVYARDRGMHGVVAEAHNDFLQILADGGLIGGILALWFLLSLTRAVANGARSRDPLSAALALGAGAGLFGMLIHSIFDFNLHLPSHAALFLTLAAVVSRIGEKAAEAMPERSRTSMVAARFAREVSSS